MPIIIGHFRYGVILPQLSLPSTVITKFEFEKEKEMNCGSCSKMTPS